MKTITLKAGFDPQKKAALEQFLAKKGLRLEDELAEYLQKLYEKQVPAQVREFLENSPKSAL